MIKHEIFAILVGDDARPPAQAFHPLNEGVLRPGPPLRIQEHVGLVPGPGMERVQEPLDAKAHGDQLGLPDPGRAAALVPVDDPPTVLPVHVRPREAADLPGRADVCAVRSARVGSTSRTSAGAASGTPHQSPPAVAPRHPAGGACRTDSSTGRARSRCPSSSTASAR